MKYSLISEGVANGGERLESVHQSESHATQQADTDPKRNR